MINNKIKFNSGNLIKTVLSRTVFRLDLAYPV